MAEAKTTTNHNEIKKWVEERDGKPSYVKGASGKDSKLLRINFPGYSGEDTLEEMEWDEFFENFDKNNLAFLYQEETKDGKESRFFKFVNRE